MSNRSKTPDESLGSALCDPESETIVIGGLLVQPACEPHHVALNIISPSDFLDPHRGNVLRAIQSLSLSSKPYDAGSVITHCTSHRIDVGSVDHILQLIQDPIVAACSPQSVVDAANRVKNLSLLRQLQARFLSLASACTPSSSFLDLTSHAQQDLSDLNKQINDSRTGPAHISSFVTADMDALEDAAQNGDPIKGVRTGITDLDLATGGLLPETVTVLGARPSMGKTALALNIADSAEADGWNVLIFSLEMTGGALTRRKISAKSRVPLATLKKGVLSDSEWSQYSEAVERLGHANIWIDETPGLSYHDIAARSRAFVSNHPKTLIIIDYLQLIAEPKGWRGERREHIENTSRAIKQLARSLRVPILALAQLSRSLESRLNKRPMMSDLKESGQIEQDAEIIVFIYRDDFYNKDSKEPGIAELIIGKNRDGPCAVVKTLYKGETMRFLNLVPGGQYS